MTRRTLLAVFSAALAEAQTSSADAAILREIEALSIGTRRLFLTGRLPLEHPIHTLIRRRVTAQIDALRRLTPAPPLAIRVESWLRDFSDQSRIVLEKFTLAGSRRRGWDTLPDRYYLGRDRRRGVDRDAWLGESSAVRLATILEFSAVPGASRHHWGTDVDFNSTENADWTPRGRMDPLHGWLKIHSAKAGLRKAYTEGRRAGHSEEPWHYSYAPLAAGVRRMHVRDVRLEQDIANPLQEDWKKRGGVLPADLRDALGRIPLADYVNVVGPGL